jgi:hypothetical protein
LEHSPIDLQRSACLATFDRPSLRQVIEIGAIVFIVLAALLQNDLKMRIATDPFPNLVIPLWAVVAYFIMSIRAELQQGRRLRSI